MSLRQVQHRPAIATAGRGLVPIAPAGMRWAEAPCVAEGLLMPLGALLMCLMISWELKADALRQEILLNGENRPWVYDFFRLCVKYITPLCMLMILYGQISDFFIV